MTEELVAIPYLLLGLPVGRMFGGYMAWMDRDHSTRLDGSAKMWGLVMAFVGIVAWPIVIFGWVWNHRSQQLLWKPPEVRERIAEEDQRRMARAVAEHERNLLER